MKEDINNEMDGLLRRLSQRNGTTPPSDHLDADELNAYAERALPEKTRLRYTEHLAECSECRRLATQLTQSSGVEPIQTKKIESSWLASFLGKFLSPFTWRLALPVLAAIGILAIGLIVLRREPLKIYSARSMAESADEKPKAAPGFLDSQSNAQPQATNPTVGERVEPRVTDQIAQNKVASDRVSTDPSESTAATTPKDQPAGSASAFASAGPSPAAAPPAPAPPETEVARLNAENQQQKTEDLKKEKQAEEDRDKAANAKEPVVAAKTRRVDDLRTASPASGVGPGSTLNMSTSTATARGRSDSKDDESKNESETKAIAGRRFQKRGTTWMDTGYNSSMPTLTLSRGSESYRALVADEPAIRTIADQLDGEVVIVWKGKAYLIR